MKFKVVLVLTFLVTASLISFSNRCNQSCDGRTMIAISAQQPADDADAAERSYETQVTESSPLLRIAVTL
jgi:hypothetical protein